MKKIFFFFAMVFSLHHTESFSRSLIPYSYFSLSDTAKVELIFGLRKPDKKLVCKKEWKLFVDEIITPRFPNGFTITDANGHWQSPGAIISEPSKIFSVVCILDDETEKKLNEIIEFYKKKFQQEAVLRINTKISYWLK
jgi:hypothetical protein